MREQKTVIKFINKQPGSLFIRNNEILFLEHTVYELSHRTKHLIKIPIKNKELQTGYSKRVNTGDRVYLAEPLVSDNNGFAHIFCINTTSKTINIPLPPIELEPNKKLKPSLRTSKIADPNTNPEPNNAERLAKIAELLPLKDLNEEEVSSVLSIVNGFRHQFHLPGDKVKGTTLAPIKSILPMKFHFIMNNFGSRQHSIKE